MATLPIGRISHLVAFLALVTLAAAAPKAPPIFQVAPLLQSSLSNDRWCNTPGVDGLASPFVRSGLFMFAGALLLSRSFSPSSQANITLPLCALILTLCIQLLYNLKLAHHSELGRHPMALELFLVALPSWLAMLCTSPLRILTHATSLNPGTMILTFLVQTAVVSFLAITQIIISVPKNRFVGMDMRQYQINRNRNSDMERVYDGSATELAYNGENLCGRRAVFASKDVLLDNNNWANFMIAWAIMAILVWVFITIQWVHKIRQYFYFSRPLDTFSTYDNVEIADSLPAIASLHSLFREGELPPRPPIILEPHTDLGMEHAETGVGGWFRYKANLQFVILSHARRHLEIQYGFGNPINISYFVMTLRLSGFALVVLSVEQTVKRWNILFGRSSSPVGKDGDFSTSRGDWQGVLEGNGILSLVLGSWAILAALNGFIGEKWYWRLVGKVADKVRADKGLGRNPFAQ
ncbi:hypothetical protein BGX38DRAFT_1238356 [Terfezia claveryi]|nr:hypothetical protein BGX38DRAFT_1238356 [Terfezia claveryi]